ncbi:hypothetical protein CCACVL1_07472 [Corchorus capsularis]|uniref:Pentatricopeptide repeat-containing protein n=1 Tax=Corchorus capsularis TaxID=210143 RepID=A0A1R3J612_COCAP|nr:hypothetical protein CCACVL1_07472 [Corchorus capsularis]
MGFQRSLHVASALVFFYVSFGKIFDARLLFDEMPKKDAVLWTAMLDGYAKHEEPQLGLELFKQMVDAGITPDWVVMLSLLLAEDFIQQMPMEPDAAILGAILAGCRVHNNVEVGERIAKKLISLEPEKAGYYVLLSNIYAAAGKFDEAEKVRECMKEKNVSKVPGCSSIPIESDSWLLQ